MKIVLKSIIVNTYWTMACNYSPNIISFNEIFRSIKTTKSFYSNVENSDNTGHIVQKTRNFPAITRSLVQIIEYSPFFFQEGLIRGNFRYELCAGITEVN